MRPVLLALALLVSGCDLYFSHGHDTGTGDPPLGDDDCGPAPADAGSCDCSNGTWWCTTCPFGEGQGPVACDAPGTGCQIENWEHGCDCTCGDDGYWSCFAETIGSSCPSGGPLLDGGVLPDAYVPDAYVPDAGV